jgi:hypothetical protein
LISEGSSKLASVPSGGGGGGGASGTSGTAPTGGAPPEEKEPEKPEGTFSFQKARQMVVANTIFREGRVRRGYGFRSFRLGSQLMAIRICPSQLANTNSLGFWKRLCGLCLSFACHGSRGSGFTGLLKAKWTSCNVDSAIQTCFFQIIESTCFAMQTFRTYLYCSGLGMNLSHHVT